MSITKINKARVVTKLNEVLTSTKKSVNKANEFAFKK
jgi:hypothetical protein